MLLTVQDETYEWKIRYEEKMASTKQESAPRLTNTNIEKMPSMDVEAEGKEGENNEETLEQE